MNYVSNARNTVARSIDINDGTTSFFNHDEETKNDQ